MRTGVVVVVFVEVGQRIMAITLTASLSTRSINVYQQDGAGEVDGDESGANSHSCRSASLSNQLSYYIDSCGP